MILGFAVECECARVNEIAVFPSFSKTSWNVGNLKNTVPDYQIQIHQHLTRVELRTISLNTDSFLVLIIYLRL